MKIFEKWKYLVFTLFLAFILISLSILANTYTIQIVSVETTDMEGNPKTTFKCGEFVVVKVTIKSLLTYEAQDYLLIVEVFNPHDVVIALGFTSGSLAPGEQVSTGYGFKIPECCTPGTFTIKVFVWNGWPAALGENWKALSAPYTTTITVKT